jgi:hypothetical protein
LEKEACVSAQAGMTGNRGKIADERKYRLLLLIFLFQFLAVTFKEFQADIL